MPSSHRVGFGSRERDAANALRRSLSEKHWAWGEEGIFEVRSRMMAKVFCYLTISDQWKYNIDLNADAYPLIVLMSVLRGLGDCD